MNEKEIDEIFSEMRKEDGKEPIIKSDDLVIPAKACKFLETIFPQDYALIKAIIDLYRFD